MASKFYVDSITLVFNENTKNREVFEGKELKDNLFDKIKSYLNEGILKRIECENSECDISITAFCEGNNSHICIVDTFEDINYYYRNDKKSNELVTIAGEEVEENLICNDNNLMLDILKYFSQKGERYTKVKWLED